MKNNFLHYRLHIRVIIDYNELVGFLKYVGNPNSSVVNEDAFVTSLDRQIDAIKRDRDWEAKFMLLEEMMKEERTEGKAEGKVESKTEDILLVLNTHGEVPEDIQHRILKEKDLDQLNRWFTLALTSKSIDEFCKNM